MLLRLLMQIIVSDMKDIEKIKSEDLAAQVQDANPANFAIEQEVAQLVGATVPQPTEPSADDARELGAQLLVFLRRALLPIRSALRTAVAAIYAHLDSRCTDYTPAAYASFMPRPYDPMRPFVPRTVANLHTALTAFAPRKISNGSAPNDGIPDGTSLAHILGDSTLGITKLIDDNYGWVCNKALPSIGTLSEATLNMVGITAANALRNTGATILRLPKLKTITSGTSQYNDPMPAASEEIYLPELTESHCIFCQADFRAKKIVAPKLRTLSGRCFYDWRIANEPLVELRLPELRNIPEGFLLCWTGDTSRKPWVNLILFEIGSDVSLNISAWNPTNALSSSASDLVADPTAHPTWKNLDQFLQNFREHIALRLTSNGSGKTLTLSQAVFDTIWNADGTPKSTDPDSVIYQINKIIKTDKHWSVNRA